MRLGRVLTLGFLLPPTLFGCFYELPRTEGLGDGEIRGVAVHTDGTPAAAARVVVQGTPRAAEAGADGSFAVRGLSAGPWVLLIVEDADGDGVPESAARVSAVLENAAIPRNATDGCAGAPAVVPTSMLLGQVELAPTRSVTGSVQVDEGGGPRALAATERALVLQSTVAPFGEDADAGLFQGPVERAAGVDDAGAFTLTGARVDELALTVLVFDAAAGPHAPSFFGTATVAGDVASAGTLVADQPVPASTGLELALSGAFESVEIGTVSFETPAGADVAPPDGTLQRAENGGFAGSLVVDAPVGLYDLGVFPSADSTDVTEGVLRAALVLPLAAWSSIAGPMELAREDPCLDADGNRDCDHDGRPTLPSPEDASALPDWAACAPACVDAWGAAGDGASCEVGGTDIDCDDDGDGQPDVTEPAHCLGPGRGTDLDGDEACEPGEDPFPACAANDPAACPAPFTPPPARY